MIQTKLISAQETYPLRIKILRDGKAKRYQFEQDNFEATFHIGAFEVHQCVGIGTFIEGGHVLFDDTFDCYQLRGMAVDDVVQGQGIGKKIIDFAIHELSKRQCQRLWCNAREIAVGFYDKMGFKVIGEPFDIPLIGKHYVMYKDLQGLVTVNWL